MLLFPCDWVQLNSLIPCGFAADRSKAVPSLRKIVFFSHFLCVSVSDGFFVFFPKEFFSISIQCSAFNILHSVVILSFLKILFFTFFSKYLVRCFVQISMPWSVFVSLFSILSQSHTGQFLFQSFSVFTQLPFSIRSYTFI